MKLSMWVIADWLKNYKPIIEIKSGESLIENIRLSTNADSNSPHSERTLYLGYSEDLFEDNSKYIICTNNNDLIKLKHDNLNEIINDLLSAIDFYNQWAESLNSALTRNCQLNELIDLTYDILPYPIALVDSNQIVLSISSHFPKDSVDTEWNSMLEKGIADIRTIIDFNRSPLRKYKNTQIPYLVPKGIFPNNNYSLPIYLNKTFIAEVVLVDYNLTVTEGTLHLFSFLGSMILKWFRLYTNQSTIHLPEQYARSLVQGETQHLEDFKHFLKLQHWQDDDTKIVVCMKSMSKEYNTDQHFCKLLTHDFNDSFSFTYNTYVVIIVNLKQNNKQLFISTLLSYLKSSQYYGAMSYEFEDISHLYDYFSQAELTLTLEAPNSGVIYDCHDYLLPYAFRVIKDNLLVPFMHPALYQLKSYDAKKKTDLFQTLFEYLKHERNQLLTAKVLNIHRNTCINRLNRIQEILDVDLDNPDTRNYLLFSYYYNEMSVNS